MATLPGTPSNPIYLTPNQVIGMGGTTTATPAQNAGYTNTANQMNAMASTPVQTSQMAQDNRAANIASFNQLQSQIQQQQMAKAQQSFVDQQNKSIEADKANQANVQQQQLAQKQQEIDGKNKSLGLLSGVDTQPASQTTQTVQNGLGAPQGTTQISTSPMSPVVQPAAQTGTSGATQQFVNSTAQIQAQKDQMYQQWNSSLNSILNGTIPLSPPQQALITSLQTQLAQNVSQQQVANQAFEGQVAEAGFRAGGEYTSQQYAGQIHEAISTGVARIQELDNKAAITMSTMEQQFQQQNYDAINKSFEVMNKQLDDKSNAVKDMYSAVTKELTDQRDWNMEVAKFKQTGDQNIFDNAYKTESLKIDKEYKQAEIAKIRNDIKNAQSVGSGTVTTTNEKGNTVSIPVDVAPYYNVSNNGVEYVDASTLKGTQAEQAKIINQAQAARYKVILNKNTAADLVNIKDANSKLDTVSTIMAGIGQPNWLARSLGGAGFTKLAQLTESNPQKAASGALESIGLDILKGISGVQGFRGNQSAIQQITDHLPKVTDTIDTINTKIDYIRQLLSDREDAAVGKPKVTDTGTDQTVNGVTYSKGSDGLYYPKK